jgi:hypothetical protein
MVEKRGFEESEDFEAIVLVRLDFYQPPVFT